MDFLEKYTDGQIDFLFTARINRFINDYIHKHCCTKPCCAPAKWSEEFVRQAELKGLDIRPVIKLFEEFNVNSEKGLLAENWKKYFHWDNLDTDSLWKIRTREIPAENTYLPQYPAEEIDFAFLSLLAHHVFDETAPEEKALVFSNKARFHKPLYTEALTRKYNYPRVRKIIDTFIVLRPTVPHEWSHYFHWANIDMDSSWKVASIEKPGKFRQTDPAKG